MRPTLTLEVNFKSSSTMDDAPALSIGDLAHGAGVPPSTIRYYDGLGLLPPDDRRSGQRRYTQAGLRRLVFIGMLQDAGLALDDIAGVLGADTVAEWKGIAAARLEVLDEEIERLQRAREYLRGALLCRFDHPATDCKVMGAEIDRRLAQADRPDAMARS
jgi:DNA-binding transcriptional MerR regulator